MSSLYWIPFVFVAYFAVLIGIAVVRSRQIREMSDYVLGGRRMSAFTMALSAGSSSASAGTMLVIPAIAFTQGMISVWILASLGLCFWLTWKLLATRLRRYTVAAEESLTLPEFLEKRFADKTGAMRTLAGGITIFFVVFYVSSGLIAGAKLLESVFGINDTVGIVITLIAVASYTFIGGFVAVSRTDVFQALIMLAGFIILPLTLVFATSDLFGTSSGVSPTYWNPLTTPEGEPLGLFFFLSAFGWGLGTFGAQRVLQRYMAVESEAKIPAGRAIGTAWVVVMLACGLLLGLFGLPALTEAGQLTEVLEDAERLYFVVTQVFFHPIFIGLLLTGVVAAIMSTADSQLLLASAVATDDLPFIRRYAYRMRYLYAAGAYGRVWLGRILLVVIGAIAAGLAIGNPESVLTLVEYAWGGMGAAFGPVTILALYWRRFNIWGALASVITGTAAASVWGYFSGGPGGIMDIQPAAPGFIIAIPVAIAVTLLTPPPSKAVVSLFDQVTSDNAE